MSRWYLTAVLSALALGAALYAQQLLPGAQPEERPDAPPVVETPEPRDVEIGRAHV